MQDPQVDVGRELEAEGQRGVLARIHDHLALADLRDGGIQACIGIGIPSGPRGQAIRSGAFGRGPGRHGPVGPRPAAASCLPPAPAAGRPAGRKPEDVAIPVHRVLDRKEPGHVQPIPATEGNLADAGPERARGQRCPAPTGLTAQQAASQRWTTSPTLQTDGSSPSSRSISVEPRRPEPPMKTTLAEVRLVLLNAPPRD